MSAPLLISVPNASEGRDDATIRALAAAFADDSGHAGEVRLLDVHSDADHHRSVFTAAGPAGRRSSTPSSGAARVARRADRRITCRRGRFRAGPASARRRARRRADRLPRPTRAAARRARSALVARRPHRRGARGAGVPLRRAHGRRRAARPARARSCAAAACTASAERMARRGAALRPDFGPAAAASDGAGATLVAARPPLVAFNVQLAAPADLDRARGVAARSARAGGHGLPGRARDRRAAERRRRAGFDERRAPARGPARRGRRSRQARTARRRERRAGRARSRRRDGGLSARTFRCRASIPLAT